jgi:hypothetical protein
MSSGKGEKSGKSGVIWINTKEGSEPFGIVMIENSQVSPIRVPFVASKERWENPQVS